MLRLIVLMVLIMALAAAAACGGEDPTATTAAPTDTPVPPTAAPTDTPVPPTAAPTATMAPTATPEQLLAEYAASKANGPGAIFVGDPEDPAAYAQLIGPPAHDGLIFLPPGDGQQEQYQQLFQAALFGLPELGIPGHQFIYTSDYYRELIEKANLLNPTELTSSGENIEIQYVCLSRTLPTCVMKQAYFAPRLAARTNGQVTLNITSFPELSGSGGAGIVADSLTLVADGTLDMVNIYTGYVAGAFPAIEVQSLWGMGPDWESTYLALADMVPDVERMLEEETGGVPVNRNWYAGADQWFFAKEPLTLLEDFQGKKIRSHSAALSSLIEGLGAEAVFIAPGADYLALQNGTVDVGTTGALLAISGRYHEISDYMTGPIIGFGYTNNVINGALWDRIPEDLQQIIIEEGAIAELEELRIAPYHNIFAVQANINEGVEPQIFSEDIIRYIAGVVLPQNIIPDWLRRLGYPERNQDAVRIFNEHAGPYIGLRIAADGTVERAPITKGPRAQ